MGSILEEGGHETYPSMISFNIRFSCSVSLGSQTLHRVAQTHAVLDELRIRPQFAKIAEDVLQRPARRILCQRRCGGLLREQEPVRQRRHSLVELHSDQRPHEEITDTCVQKRVRIQDLVRLEHLPHQSSDSAAMR